MGALLRKKTWTFIPCPALVRQHTGMCEQGRPRDGNPADEAMQLQTPCMPLPFPCQCPVPPGRVGACAKAPAKVAGSGSWGCGSRGDALSTHL